MREIAGADHWLVHQKTAEVTGLIEAFSVRLMPSRLDAAENPSAAATMSNGDEPDDVRIEPLRGQGDGRRGQCGRTAHCRNRAAVAAVVHAATRQTIDAGLGELAVAGLDRAALEPILTYCAEQRCEARRRHLSRLPAAHGAARHQDVRRFRRRPCRDHVQGLGPAACAVAAAKTLTAESLEHSAKTWAGEEYWFWARRVLRKLRHGIRRASQSGAPPPGAGASAGR